jgi:hypothetical protein
VTKFLLVLATVADLALAALLVGVSGFLFGGGPESMHAGFLTMVGYVAAVIGCLAAPIAGFTFNRRVRAGFGLAAAWVPVAGATAALMIPAPY